MSQTKAQLLDGSVVSVAFSAGSAATPSLYFAGDLNTGIYSPGTDQVAVATNGTGRLFVDASGNVGVGTSTPNTNGYGGTVLGLYGAVNNGGNIWLTSEATTAGNRTGRIGFGTEGNTSNKETARIWSLIEGSTAGNIGGNLVFNTKADGAGLTERLRITEAGLVGIGTSSPGALLEANGGDIRMVNTNGRIYLSNGNTSGGAKIGVRGTSGTANGYLAFETNDIEFARFDSSGRLGIGTTSPGDLLTLNSTVGYPLATFNDSGTFRGQIGYTFDYGYFHVTSASTLGFRANGSERARIDSSGRVGIGTTVANSKLSIGLGSSTNDGLTLTFTGDNSTVARFFADTATGQVSIGGIGASYFPVFYAGAAEKARIDTSGRLLVGTSSARSNFFNGVASAALQLEGTGTNRRAAIIGDDFEASLILASQKSGAVGGNTVLASGDPVGAVSFQGNDGSEFVEAATITAFVDGTPGANDMPGRLVFSTTADGAATPTERLRIDSSGRLLVGTSTTGLQNTRSMLWQGSGEAALYINHSTSDGSGDPFIKFGYNGGEIGSITQSGTTAVAYNTSSDYRLKENVTPVTDGITRLQQLNPSRFNFIADPAKTVDGFIAHEVQVVVPEAITGEKDAEDDDGNPIYQGIDQSKLVPLLTAALQEAIAKIESLEARLTAAGI